MPGSVSAWCGGQSEVSAAGGGGDVAAERGCCYLPPLLIREIRLLVYPRLPRRTTGTLDTDICISNFDS